MGTRQPNAGGNPMVEQHIIQGGVEIFLVVSCYRDKLRLDGPSARMQTFLYFR